MRFSTLYTFVTAAVLASAGPIRVARQTPPMDENLVFLNVLEAGATAYYQAVVDTFNASAFQTAGFVNGDAVFSLVNTIANSESDHLQIIASTSGTPPPNCTLDFSPALTDPVTALSVARVLEFLAITSYVDAIATDTSANNAELFAEIMGNEARHNDWLGMLLGGDVFPNSFELGMTQAEVLTNLLPFNPSCTPALPLTPNAPLSITSTGPTTNGTALTFDLSNTPCANQTNLFCQILTASDAAAAALPISNCSLEGIDGGALVYVTTDSTQISADPVQRSNLTNLCAGPAVVFADPSTTPPLDALLFQPPSSANSTA